MKRTLLYLCMASVLLSGCWSEDDGEENYQDKPQRAASLTMERAMGLLCELMLSAQEKGDTLLMNQQTRNLKIVLLTLLHLKTISQL